MSDAPHLVRSLFVDGNLLRAQLEQIKYEKPRWPYPPQPQWLLDLMKDKK